MHQSTSTLDDVCETSTPRAASWGRRGFLALLLVFVMLGASGYLGVHSRSATASSNGYTLDVHYAQFARAGLDVPLVVTVTHAGGFGKQLVLAVTSDYFDIFETQGFYPDPSATTRDGDTLFLTFDAPTGDVFRFSYDAYIQPSSQRGKSATVTVVDAGVPVVSTHITTHLLP